RSPQRGSVPRIKRLRTPSELGGKDNLVLLSGPCRPEGRLAVAVGRSGINVVDPRRPRRRYDPASLLHPAPERGCVKRAEGQFTDLQTGRTKFTEPHRPEFMAIGATRVNGGFLCA